MCTTPGVAVQTLPRALGSEVFIVRPAGSLRALDIVDADGPPVGLLP
jgi:hypothetical protein